MERDALSWLVKCARKGGQAMYKPISTYVN